MKIALFMLIIHELYFWVVNHLIFDVLGIIIGSLAQALTSTRHRLMPFSSTRGMLINIKIQKAVICAGAVL
jgi:hypothetical protein